MLDARGEHPSETPQQEILPPLDLDRVKATAISRQQLHYDNKDGFLFALAPNGMRSHLSEQQWLLSRTDFVRNWLKWEDVLRMANFDLFFKIKKPGFFERRNLRTELERIKVENPIPEHRALATVLTQNPPVCQSSDFLLYGNSIGWAVTHTLDTTESTGKYLMLSQSIVPTMVPLNAWGYQRTQTDVDQTMLHEYFHYYTHELFKMYEEFSKQGRLDELRKYTSPSAVEFASRCKALYDKYKIHLKMNYNIDEFLASGLTGATDTIDGFEKAKKVPYPGKRVSPNEVAKKALSDVGVEGSFYNEMLTLFINYYVSIDPKLFSDRVDENCDPLPEHVELALEMYRNSMAAKK